MGARGAAGRGRGGSHEGTGESRGVGGAGVAFGAGQSGLASRRWSLAGVSVSVTGLADGGGDGEGLRGATGCMTGISDGFATSRAG